MSLMVHRVDSWSSNEDKILIEAVIENARNNAPKEEAFEIASKRLTDRSKSACSNRWYQIKSKVINNPSLKIEEVVNIPDQPVEQSTDYIDTLLGGQEPREVLKLNGVYLQQDVENVLNWLGKKGGRGTKSRIVNELLKAAFIEKGLL